MPRWRILLSALLYAALALRPPSDVWAAERAAVLVYPAQQAVGLSAPAVSQELRLGLAEQKVVVLEGAIEQGLRALSEKRTQPLVMKLGAARELLLRGQRHLAEVELEQAQTALLEAERRCEEALLLQEAPALLGEVLRWRAVALFELGKREEAQKLFRQALVLAPLAALTEAEVRPEVAQAFRRQAAALGEKVQVQIVPQLGAGALRAPAALLAAVSVLVDGVEVPLVQSRGLAEHALMPGEHVVVVRAPGYLAALQRVALVEAKALPVVLSPDPGDAALLRLRRGPTSAGLVALCDALQLKDVLLAAIGRDGGEDVIAGQRFGCGTGAATKAAVVRRGGTEALRPLVGRLLLRLSQTPPADGPREPDLLSERVLAQPRPAPPKRVPIYARPWLWIGAAAIVSGVLLGVALRPQPPQQTTLVVDTRGFALRF